MLTAIVEFGMVRAPSGFSVSRNTGCVPLSRTNERLSSLPKCLPTGRLPGGTPLASSGVPAVAVAQPRAETVSGVSAGGSVVPVSPVPPPVSPDSRGPSNVTTVVSEGADWKPEDESDGEKNVPLELKVAGTVVAVVSTAGAAFSGTVDGVVVSATPDPGPPARGPS